jgi:Leucine-rich repeat (LRR) protein
MEYNDMELIQYLSYLLDENPYLTSIDLKKQGLKELSKTAIEILSKFKELKTLDLSQNEIRSLPTNMHWLKSLEEISLLG